MAKKTAIKLNIEYFQSWLLTGKGKVVGKFPLPDGVRPDNFIELHRDRVGKIVLIRETYEEFSGPIVRRPHFDAKGRLNYSDRDGPSPLIKLRNSYEYGTNGMLKVRKETDRTTKALRFRTTTKCDKSGNITEHARHGPDGKIQRRGVYEFDASGNIVKEQKYVGEALLGHFSYGYDSAGREVRRVWTDVEGEERATCVTRYNDHDLPISVAFRPTGEPSLTSVMTYAPTGKRLSKVLTDDQGGVLQDQRSLPDGTVWRQSKRQIPEASSDSGGSMGAVHEGLTDEQAGVMMSKAFHLFQQNDFIEALPLFQMLAQKYPEDPYFISAAATCSLKLLRFEAAIMYYQEALKIDPAHAESLKGMALARDITPDVFPDSN